MENVPISKLILFVSTVPEARMCRTLMNILNSRGILQQLNGFLSMVRLDTEESRRKVMNGKYFSITQVPSLVVILQNNVTKIYSGTEKIARYLDLLVNPPQTEYNDQNPYGGKYVNLDEQASAFENSKNRNKKIVIGDDPLPIEEDGYANGESQIMEGEGLGEPIEIGEPLEVGEEIQEIGDDFQEINENPKPKKTSKKSSKKSTKKSSQKSSKKMTLKTAEKMDSEVMMKAKAMQAQFDSKIELTTPKPKK